MLTTKFTKAVDRSVSDKITTEINDRLASLLRDLSKYLIDYKTYCEFQSKLECLQSELTTGSDKLALFDSTFEKFKELLSEAVNRFKNNELIRIITQHTETDINNLLQEYSNLEISKQIKEIFQKALTESGLVLKDDYFYPGFFTIFTYLKNHSGFTNQADKITASLFNTRFNVDSDIENFISQFSGDDLDEDTWYFICNFVKSSQAHTKIKYLFNLVRAAEKDFSNKNNFQALIASMRSLKSPESPESPNLNLVQIFLLSHINENLVIPDEITEIVGDRTQYTNMVFRVREEILLTLKLDRESLIKQFDKVVNAKIINSIYLNMIIDCIKQAALKAAEDYKEENVKDKGFIYFIYHGETGKSNVASLLLALDDELTTPEVKLEIVAQFLRRHEPSIGFLRTHGFFRGRGLREHSYDTLFLTYLFNEDYPQGLFGHTGKKSILTKGDSDSSEDKEEQSLTIPEQIEFPVPAYSSIKGAIPPALVGDSRFEDSSDRNEIRACTAIMFSRIKAKQEEVREKISELQIQLSPQV